MARRCVYEYCDCREHPEIVTDLIHERDRAGRPYTIKARREEAIIQAQIDFILGTYDDDVIDAKDPLDELEKRVWYELTWKP